MYFLDTVTMMQYAEAMLMTVGVLGGFISFAADSMAMVVLHLHLTALPLPVVVILSIFPSRGNC